MQGADQLVRGQLGIRFLSFRRTSTHPGRGIERPALQKPEGRSLPDQLLPPVLMCVTCLCPNRPVFLFLGSCRKPMKEDPRVMRFLYSEGVGWPSPILFTLSWGSHRSCSSGDAPGFCRSNTFLVNKMSSSQNLGVGFRTFTMAVVQYATVEFSLFKQNSTRRQSRTASISLLCLKECKPLHLLQPRDVLREMRD